MNITLILSSILLLAGSCLLIPYFVILIINNGRIESEDKNHLRNSYPYLYYMDMSYSLRIIEYALLFFSCFSMAAGACLYFTYLGEYYSIMLAIIYPLSIILLGISNVISLSQYKAHLIITFSSFALFIVSCLAICFITVIPKAINSSSEFALPIIVIFGIIGFILFIALFNPKLLDWARMDKTEVNGATYYLKPKYNFMALYEWIYLILMGISSILLFINMEATGIF